MKKTAAILCAALALSLGGCSSSAQDSITVISREDGSGTRGAFTEIFGIEEDGNDRTLDTAEITNSTSVMITTVAGNKNAIGYISLGSLNSDVRAVNIDGVAASVETVRDGSYPVSRPFLIVTSEAADTDGLQGDFISFIESEQGAAVIEEAGYIAPETTTTYTASSRSGSLSVGGSSSVTPVMEKLAEAYMQLNPEADITVQQSDSSTGASGTVSGMYDIGMLSRELSAEESGELSAIQIATDGIAVIVNLDNAVETLEKEQVREIYTGVITSWSEIEK